MTTITLSLVVIIYLSCLILSAPTLIKNTREVRGKLRLIAFAWAAVFIGQGQMFTHEQTRIGTISLDAGAYYQLAWMLVGFTLIILAFLQVKIHIRKGKVGIIGLLIYSIVGIAGAAFSPSPSLSVYKAVQILMDVALLSIVLSILMHNNKPRAMLELSYFLLSLVLANAALGGLLWPEIAFESIEGAYTEVLRSVYPHVHFNELGLLSAIMLIVSLRRCFEKNTGTIRIYWFGVLCISATVLFYAQARTSLASAAIAIVILAISIPRLRPFVFVGTLLAITIVSAQWIEGDINLDISGTTTETYLRRGASDKQIETLSGRTLLWSVGWEMFKDSPIIGHGMDAGVRIGGVKYGLVRGTNMHSAHMQILVNNGLIGYLAWLIFIFAVVLSLWRKRTPLRTMRYSEESRFYLEISLVAFVILFRSFLGSVLVTHHFSFLIFIALFICAIGNKHTTKSNNQSSKKSHIENASLPYNHNSNLPAALGHDTP